MHSEAPGNFDNRIEHRAGLLLVARRVAREEEADVGEPGPRVEGGGSEPEMALHCLLEVMGRLLEGASRDREYPEVVRDRSQEHQRVREHDELVAMGEQQRIEELGAVGITESRAAVRKQGPGGRPEEVVGHIREVTSRALLELDAGLLEVADREGGHDPRRSPRRGWWEPPGAPR